MVTKQHGCDTIYLFHKHFYNLKFIHFKITSITRFVFHRKNCSIVTCIRLPTNFTYMQNFEFNFHNYMKLRHTNDIQASSAKQIFKSNVQHLLYSAGSMIMLHERRSLNIATFKAFIISGMIDVTEYRTQITIAILFYNTNISTKWFSLFVKNQNVQFCI